MNDIKETAKEIRIVLKKEFPITKFSVTISRFSQGESVAISWTDGPMENEVRPLVKMYGDGELRFVKTIRKRSAVSIPEPQSVEVVTEAVSQLQEPARDLTSQLIDLQELLISKLEEVNQLKLQIAELQVERDAAKYNQQQPKKAKIAQITLTRDEGTIAESGTTLIASGWLDAVRILKKWAATVSSPTHADKCKIFFEFADGESFKLSSFGLKQEHRFKLNLAQELLTELQHLAGEIIPAHMTQQDYENYCKFCNIEPANYKRLLNNWEIPA